jgi:hypothetical protein
MIHAFLITIAVLTAIYAYPFVVLALCLCFKILTSKWFWLSFLGLTLFIVGCCFIGPTMFLLLGGAYLIWRLTAWSEFFKSRKAHREALRETHREALREGLIRFFDPGPLPTALSVSKKNCEPLPCNGTTKSDAIDWSKL